MLFRSVGKGTQAGKIKIQYDINTVSSTIPIALYDSMKFGRLGKGDSVLVMGFGVGLSWGGTVLHML